MNYTEKGKNDSTTHESIVIINCVLNASFMLISIIGNALVLAAILRTPSIRSASMIMLCSLAVSDLLVGFVAQPLYIADERKSLSGNVCKSGPLHFGSERSFPSNFVQETILGHK